MKKQPEKTAQTRQNMIDAFWLIAKSRGLANITISEVTKKAGLNRGTFYVYFTDIDDLLYQAEQEIITDLRYRMSAVIEGTIVPDMRTISSKAIEIFGQYDDILFLLLGKNGDPNFLDMVRKETSVVFNSVLQPQGTNPYQEYIVAYVTSAFTGLLLYWHETGKKIALEELSGIAYGILLNGIQSKQ